MTKRVEGCAHFIVKNGKVINVYTHLNSFPRDGVIHLKGHKIYSFSEFRKSHPFDHSELKKNRQKVIISTFDLPTFDKKGKKK
jgi:hypothetical protein